MARELQSGWGRAPVQPGRVRSQYANFWLPDQVPPAMAIWQAQAAIGGRLGWHPNSPAQGAGDAMGYATWTHRDTGLQLLLVLAGLRPLIVAVGQRKEREVSLDNAAPSDLAATGRTMRGDLAVVGQALKQIDLAYRTLGGRTVAEGQLLGLVRQAQEQSDRMVAAEHRLEQLTPCLTHRLCPMCRTWSRHQARWCHACRYEFTPQDNFARDDATARAQREIDAFRMQASPSAPPPAPPPSASPTHTARGW
jgi:hypothetical protein